MINNLLLNWSPIQIDSDSDYDDDLKYDDLEYDTNDLYYYSEITKQFDNIFRPINYQIIANNNKRKRRFACFDLNDE